MRGHRSSAVKSASKDGPSCSSGVGPPLGSKSPMAYICTSASRAYLRISGFGVPAMIIASVGYDEQRFLCVVCPFHLTQAQINSVQQRRLAARRGKHQTALQFFHAGSEVLASCARSLKFTSRNSSCGFAVRKNCTAASRDFSILSLMLPLISKITPIEIGTSSLEKRTISCSMLSSNTRKFSCSKSGHQSPIRIRYRNGYNVLYLFPLCSDLPFSILWEFSGRWGPTCAPEGIARSQHSRKSKQRAKSRNRAPSSWLRCAVLATWPPPCRETRLALGSSANLLAAIVHPRTFQSKRSCLFYISSDIRVRQD